MPRTYSKTSVEERVRRRMVHEGDHWLWNGRKDKNGYGRFDVSASARSRLAHRVVWEIHCGSIPQELTLDHLCRVRACVNPSHLEAVTQAVNALRGESVPAQRARQTECKMGHELVGYNAIISAKGHRRCRRCHREWHNSKRRRAGNAS